MHIKLVTDAREVVEKVLLDVIEPKMEMVRITISRDDYFYRLLLDMGSDKEPPI